MEKDENPAFQEGVDKLTTAIDKQYEQFADTFVDQMEKHIQDKINQHLLEKHLKKLRNQGTRIKKAQPIPGRRK